MHKEIRVLNSTDHRYLATMQTNIEDDYVIQSFNNLIKGPNTLYGLFIDDQLASLAGYSVFAGQSAILGRLRSDIRFSGHGFATEIMAYIRDAAFKHPNIKWVGANTQAENKPSRRVLEKIGFTPNIPTYGGIASDISTLHSSETTWKEIHCLPSKKQWIEKTYITKTRFFPYECYYPLPAVKELFTDATLDQWSFYENADQTRVVIMKEDQKGRTFLHVIYPWDDIMQQKGLWETIAQAHNNLMQKHGQDTSIWMDLTEKAVQSLPENHPFELPSPWILYSMERTNIENDYN